MIRHNDIPTNSPTVSIMSCAPFVGENFGNVDTSQKRLSLASACCHKINRSVDPNTLQSPQVLVHTDFVADSVDLPRAQEAATYFFTAVSARGYNIIAARRKRTPGHNRKFFRLQSNRTG